MSLISKALGLFRKTPQPEGDPRLLEALAAADMARAHILAEFPDGDLPPDAQAHLDKIDHMRAMAQAALAADAAGDLEALVGVAAQVKDTAPTSLLVDLTEEEAARFQTIDDTDLAAVADAWSAEVVNTPCGQDGLTALAYALARPDPELPVILALLDAGADAAAPVAMGGTALTALAYGLYDDWTSTEIYELTKALVALGAGAETRDGDGLTPLQRAVLHQNPPVTEALLRAGADANARFDLAEGTLIEYLNGSTILHAAVLDPELTRLLLIYGADPNARDQIGDTPAAFAQAMLDDQPDAQERARLCETLHLLQEDSAA